MKIDRFNSHPKRQRRLLLVTVLLLALSFLTSWYFGSRLSMSHQQQLLQHYVTSQLNDAQAITRDTVLMSKLVLHKESPQEFQALTKKRYGLFLFAETISDNQDLLFWNNQKIIPPPADFDSTYGTFFQQLLNGYYVTQKTKLVLPGMSNNVIAYVLVPVLHKYYVETENSQTQFAHDKNAIKKIDLATLRTDFPILSPEQKALFYLKPVNSNPQFTTDAITIILRLAALVLFLIAMHFYAERIYKRQGGLKGILFLIGALIVARGIVYLVPPLFSLRRIPLFDPAVYGSDLLINKSLGDLLINAILLCWIILFAWNRLGASIRLPAFIRGNALYAAGATGLFVLIYTTFLLATVVNNLVVNSKISFAVTDFSQLDINTAVSFLVLALLSLSYYYFSRLLFRFILLCFPNLLQLYFAVAAFGLLFLTFQQRHDEVLFRLPVLLWLVIFTLLLTQEQSIINRFRITIAGLLFWVFVFSISLAALIMQGNQKREEADQRRMATKMEELIEPTKQTVLSIALAYLDNRFLKYNFRRFYREPQNAVVRDSITNSGMADYSSVYNTSIYVYNANTDAINNPDPRTYAELNNIFTEHSRPTGQRDLVYYETSPFQFVYLIKREVTDDNGVLGTVFLLATPKQFQGKEALYPDIFRRMRNDVGDPNYLTAIYRNGDLMRYTGTYPFPLKLNSKNIPTSEFEAREEGDYKELWYKASNQKIIIVARKKDSLIESITLFSYLFCAFLFMVGTIRLFEFLARVMASWPKIDVFSRLNIRSQIQSTIIFISVLSFLIIGIATISFFRERSKRNNIQELSDTSTAMLNEIQKRVRENNLALTSSFFSDTTASSSLRNVVTDIANIHGVIVNIYDLQGTLQVTSDEQIYKKGVLSTKMDPTAFYHLSLLKEVQRIQEETVSDFQYNSIYKVIRDSGNHATYAYLNIPSFTSEMDVKQEISNFLVTIINLNAFIVLIAGVIALFITNRITRSFSVIGNKMKEITLGKTNEAIEWNKEDEIGELVKQYNKMVLQLEQSASALAKSEREGAWREMARQVAHEIKNPLTPMKLSIQYLQRAIQTNQSNVKELTTSVASTLIEQIDHLSKIAADFSQFANIGNKRAELIDLHNVIGSLLDLYSTNPKVEVNWRPLSQPLTMQADKTHMNRLLTNLLTNAVDACSGRSQCLVTIDEQRVGDDVLLSITDNGDGIPAEMQPKIFTPNFTTKTSGTGLGLAMCKGIVEQASGAIWFETKEGVGTTFFVRLPLTNV